MATSKFCSKLHFEDLFKKSRKIALVTVTLFCVLREKKGVYAVTIEAQDGAPSSVFKNGRPNTAKNKFRIVIADKNDNPPEFEQREYHADIPEDADKDAKVLEVEVKDSDTKPPSPPTRSSRATLARSSGSRPRRVTSRWLSPWTSRTGRSTG